MKRSLIKMTICCLVLLIGCSEKPDGYYHFKLNKALKNTMENIPNFTKGLEVGKYYIEGARKKGYETIIYDFDKHEVNVVSIKSQDIELNRSRLRIGLIDGNNDGIYNQISTDGLVLSRYKRDSFFIDFQTKHTSRFKERNFFEVDDILYEITEISEAGKYIAFRKAQELDKSYRIAMFESLLPRIMLKDDRGKDIQLGSIKTSNKESIVILSDEKFSSRDKELLEALGSKLGEHEELLLIEIVSDYERLKEEIKPEGDSFPIYKVDYKICEHFPCINYNGKKEIIEVNKVGLVEYEGLLKLEEFIESKD